MGCCRVKRGGCRLLPRWLPLQSVECLLGILIIACGLVLANNVSVPMGSILLFLGHALLRVFSLFMRFPNYRPSILLTDPAVVATTTFGIIEPYRCVAKVTAVIIFYPFTADI